MLRRPAPLTAAHTRMASRFGKLLESLPARLTSTWVRPDVLPKATAELLDPALSTLHVLELGGLADRTALNTVCARLMLPHPGDPLHTTPMGIAHGSRAVG